MSAKHTPGPWQAVRNSVYWEIRIAHEGKFDRQLGDLCATGCEPGHDSGEEEANARLCAAAPDLLDALEPFAHFAEAVVRFAEGSGNFPKTGALYCLHGHGLEEREITVEHFRAALSAIAKARGDA